MRDEAITLEGLRAFQAVARAGGFARAEALLGRTQATVSKRVMALERAVGVALFERRGPRRPVLTQAGRRLAGILHSLTTVIDDLPEILARDADGPLDALRILASQSIATFLLPEALARLAKVLPGVQVQVRVARHAELSDAVIAGSAALGVTTRRPEPELGLMFAQVQSSPLVAVVAREHPLAGASNVTRDQLAQCPLILPDSDSHLRSAIDACLREQAGAPEAMVEAGCWDAILAYARTGCGVGIVPACVAATAPAGLVTATISPALPEWEMGVVLQRESMDRAQVKGFLQAIFAAAGRALPSDPG